MFMDPDDDETHAGPRRRSSENKRLSERKRSRVAQKIKKRPRKATWDYEDCECESDHQGSSCPVVGKQRAKANGLEFLPEESSDSEDDSFGPVTQSATKLQRKADARITTGDSSIRDSVSLKRGIARRGHRNKGPGNAKKEHELLKAAKCSGADDSYDSDEATSTMPIEGCVAATLARVDDMRTLIDDGAVMVSSSVRESFRLFVRSVAEDMLREWYTLDAIKRDAGAEQSGAWRKKEMGARATSVHRLERTVLRAYDADDHEAEYGTSENISNRPITTIDRFQNALHTLQCCIRPPNPVGTDTASTLDPQSPPANNRLPVPQPSHPFDT